VLEGFCFLGGPPETSPRPLSNAPIFVAIGVVTASEEDPERDARAGGDVRGAIEKDDVALKK
jgi:hypothetical protein